MDSYLGYIFLFAGNFAPTGNAFCDGSLFSIANNESLFNLIGTTYGGDGQNTFALPDLRGRHAVGQGNLAGGGTYQLGQTFGTENVTLTPNQMPLHNHSLLVNNMATAAGAALNPSSTTYLSSGPFVGSGPNVHQLKSYAPADGSANPVSLTGNSVTVNGGGQPFDRIQPYLAVNHCIVLEGIYPTQN